MIRIEKTVHTTTREEAQTILELCVNSGLAVAGRSYVSERIYREENPSKAFQVNLVIEMGKKLLIEVRQEAWVDRSFYLCENDAPTGRDEHPVWSNGNFKVTESVYSIGD